MPRLAACARTGRDASGRCPAALFPAPFPSRGRTRYEGRRQPQAVEGTDLMDATETAGRTCPVCGGAGRPQGAANGETVFACPGCGLWFYDAAVRNRPATDEDWYADAEKTAPARLAACLADMTPAFARQINALEALAPERSLLDVGCGVGLFLAAAARRGWRVAGVEKTPDAHRAARDAFGLVLSDDPAAAEGGPFGAVRFSHVLEHVADPVAFVAESTARLMPGGIAVALVPNVRPLCYSAVNRLRRAAGRDGGRVVAPMQPGHHILGFTQGSLRTLFARAGLEPVRTFDISMGSRTYYPMFYDGLMSRQKMSDFPAGQLLRYWLPIFADNLGNPFGRGQWAIGYFRKPA